MTPAAEAMMALTKAQKAMLVEIDRGQPREYALGKTGFALMSKGLVFVNELGARHLTDAGHAARARTIEAASGEVGE